MEPPVSPQTCQVSRRELRPRGGAQPALRLSGCWGLSKGQPGPWVVASCLVCGRAKDAQGLDWTALAHRPGLLPRRGKKEGRQSRDATRQSVATFTLYSGFFFARLEADSVGRERQRAQAPTRALAGRPRTDRASGGGRQGLGRRGGGRGSLAGQRSRPAGRLEAAKGSAVTAWLTPSPGRVSPGRCRLILRSAPGSPRA